MKKVLTGYNRKVTGKGKLKGLGRRQKEKELKRDTQRDQSVVNGRARVSKET